jgi:V8-like Glu-specific endopeptidase
MTFFAALPLRADDGQRVLVDALSYPWSAIGRVNTGGSTYCTGFLISEYHVLTAGHCLFDPRRDRWRLPSELHFVAAYQFDQILMHSPVASYGRAGGRSPAKVPDSESATRDWAILTLSEPIGRVAGWLGMKVIGETFPERIEANRVAMVQAGYGVMRPHAITMSRGCEPMTLLSNKDIFAHGCEIMDGDSGSPWLLYLDGQFYAAGLHVVTLATEERRYAGVLSFNIFSEGGTTEAQEAFADLDLSWGRGKEPGKFSPARAVVRRDLDSLLLSKSSGADAAEPAWGRTGISLADVIREITMHPAPESVGTE